MKRVSVAGLIVAGSVLGGVDVLPAGAVDTPGTQWEGDVDESVGFHGGFETYASNQRAKHKYASNPITSTLVAVSCDDTSVWLGSLQSVSTSDHGVRTLSGELANSTCWKVRVRNSTNTVTYRFYGLQKSTFA